MPTLKNYLDNLARHPERSEGSPLLKSGFFAPLRMTMGPIFTLSLKGRVGRGQLFKPNQIFILAIRIYQNSLALIFPRSCRFYPSCSEYGILALRKFGLFKGMWLIIKRISKCHPWHSGGYDPI